MARLIFWAFGDGFMIELHFELGEMAHGSAKPCVI